MPYDVKNKVIIITGGAGGLGRELTSQLLNLGAKVAVLDRETLPESEFAHHFSCTSSHEPSKESSKESFNARTSGFSQTQQNNLSNLLSIKVDITHKGELNLAFNQVINHFSRVDILINNAGITHLSRFQNTSAELFDTIMAVNFTASVNLTRLCLPLIKQTQGQIIAISSVAGFAPLYGRTAYSASKHAMEGFFTSLASEVKDDNVHVAIISPSFVKSRPELTAHANQGVSSPGAMKKATNGEQLSPQFAASAIIKTIQNKHHSLRLGNVAKIAYWLHSLFPKWYLKLMTKSAKKEFINNN